MKISRTQMYALLFAVLVVVALGSIVAPVPSSPSTLILGRWESIRAEPELSELWGFVENGHGDRMRVYDLATATSAPRISALRNWMIEKQDGKYILNEYFYGDSKPDAPLERYLIDEMTADSLTVRSLSDSSVIPDASSVPKVFRRVMSASDEASASFALSDQDRKNQCGFIMNGLPTDHEILLPITCRVSVASSTSPLDITLTREGDVQVMRDGKTIFEKGSGDDTGTDILSLSDGPFLVDDALQLQDVTYDGYKDLAIRTSAGAYNFTYDYYPYDPKTGTFASTSILELVNPSFDEKAKTATSYDLGRGIGDIYLSETYHFEQGAYKLVRTESQDFLNVDSIDEGPHFRVIRELKNGVWATTTAETISDQQLQDGE